MPHVALTLRVVRTIIEELFTLGRVPAEAPDVPGHTIAVARRLWLGTHIRAEGIYLVVILNNRGWIRAIGSPQPD